MVKSDQVFYVHFFSSSSLKYHAHLIDEMEKRRLREIRYFSKVIMTIKNGLNGIDFSHWDSSNKIIAKI